MIPDSFWFSADSIMGFVSSVLTTVGGFLSFIFGVGESALRIGDFNIYALDIVLAATLAGIIMFYMTFSEKFAAIGRQRDARIQNMYIKETPVTEKNRRWEHISYLVRTPNPADWKIAIIDCDNMLDDLFQRLGYPGATLGERMKNANTANFPMLQEAWEAHKVRNRIAHDSGFHLDAREALRVYYLYEKVFRDAGYV